LSPFLDWYESYRPLTVVGAFFLHNFGGFILMKQLIASSWNLALQSRLLIHCFLTDFILINTVASSKPTCCKLWILQSSVMACRVWLSGSSPHLCSHLNMTDLQGAPIKNNPLGKIHYLSYCKRFFTKFTAFTEEDSHHIRSKFRHNICYGLKITTIWSEKYSFLIEPVIKLQFWCKKITENTVWMCQWIIMFEVLC